MKIARRLGSEWGDYLRLLINHHEQEERDRISIGNSYPRGLQFLRMINGESVVTDTCMPGYLCFISFCVLNAPDSKREGGGGGAWNRGVESPR